MTHANGGLVNREIRKGDWVRIIAPDMRSHGNITRVVYAQSSYAHRKLYGVRIGDRLVPELYFESEIAFVESGFWTEWRGSLDGRPTIWIKSLVKLFGCSIDLHKMTGIDDEDCFHTHPATAIRIILWGGYEEQTPDLALHAWMPGRTGIVRPVFAHRISWVFNDKYSLSLWIRFRKTAEVKLIGKGWADQRGS